MKMIAGWHCPDLLSGPGNYLNKNQDAELALEHTKSRRTAIQAGGHIGTWPVYLSSSFSRVITFEPELANFTALVANLGDRGISNVFPARGVLGRKGRPHDLHLSIKSTGQHRIGKGDAVPGFTIDALGMADVDAIFLDVEGFEVPALQGARKTIERCRPVIMCEENRRALDHGYRIGDLERLLVPSGYRKVAAINEDLIFAPI